MAVRGWTTLWQRTQDPGPHERWDLRFTGIAYAAPPAAGAPQRFAYTTRLGFGLAIRGGGETIAERDRPDGGRVSALRFWSGDRAVADPRGPRLLDATPRSETESDSGRSTTTRPASGGSAGSSTASPSGR